MLIADEDSRIETVASFFFYQDKTWKVPGTHTFNTEANQVMVTTTNGLSRL